MYSNVLSGGFIGIKSYIVGVEVDVSRALPGFDMVGKLSCEVREAKERVKVALKNCGVELPPVAITVNLSPADIHKSGTAYDLPIAIGIMCALGSIDSSCIADTLIIGELGLNGEVRRVNGILPIIMVAKEEGMKRCIVPSGNYDEAICIEGIEIVPADDFNTLLHSLQCGVFLHALQSNEYSDNDFPDSCPPSGSHSDTVGFCNDFSGSCPPSGSHSDTVRSDKTLSLHNNALIKDDKQSLDFADIKGQETCKRAALIAAAGFHHLLISGPPGAGKTMIAKRLPTIMPPLSPEESLEVSTIYSVSGLLNEKQPLITMRPFLSPHHTTTRQALTGGGTNPRPGIVSLSHKGVLFLDELPEFSRDCLEVLREPLEDKTIQIARTRSTFTYPADFMLIAAANPCPCGYYPNRNLCNCTEPMIAKYRNKISGPMMDRIDLIVTAEKIDIDNLINNTASDSIYTTANMKKEVMRVRQIEDERFKGTSLKYNSDITPKLMELYCPLDAVSKQYMTNAYKAMNLTARSYHKILRVARTIADLDNSRDIQVNHLKEALCYRG